MTEHVTVTYLHMQVVQVNRVDGEDILSWPVKEAVTRGSGGWVRQISESVIPRARKRQRTRNCQEQIKPHF